MADIDKPRRPRMKAGPDGQTLTPATPEDEALIRELGAAHAAPTESPVPGAAEAASEASLAPEPYEAQLFRNAAGDIWHFDASGNAVVMDDAAEEEQARQTKEPDTPPLADFPQYSHSIGKKEIPASRKREGGATLSSAADSGEQSRSESGVSLDMEKETLKMRAAVLLHEGKMSATFHDVFVHDVSASGSEADLAIFKESLARIEQDDRTFVPERGAGPARERAARIRNAVKMVTDHIESGEPDLAARLYASRRRFLEANDVAEYDSQFNEYARRTGRALPFVVGAAEPRDRMSRVEPRASSEGPSQGPPRTPSDALRQPGDSGGDRGRAENPYKIDRRNYVGLNVMTVQEILADKTHQQFFGELLNAINPDTGDVLKRYYADGATPEDLSFMNYARHEYSKWNHVWEELSNHLTDVDVDVFMRRNEMMDNIVGHVGGARGLDVLKNMLRYTAMRDQKTFESIEHAVHAAHAMRDSHLGARAETKIGKIAERVGIDRKAFDDVFDLSTAEGEKESHEHVERLLRAKAGGGRKVMDWLTDKTGIAFAGSSRIAADNALADAKYALRGRLGVTGRKLDRLGAHLDHAGHDLSKVVGGQEVINQVTREAMTNEKHRPGMEAGPQTFAAAKESIERITPQSIEQKITERMRTDPRWESGGRAYQDSVLSGMKKDARTSLNAGTGFWAWLLQTVFGTKFDTAATKATGRPVHVH